jgi:hypothetical protein
MHRPSAVAQPPRNLDTCDPTLHDGIKAPNKYFREMNVGRMLGCTGFKLFFCERYKRFNAKKLPGVSPIAVDGESMRGIVNEARNAEER